MIDNQPATYSVLVVDDDEEDFILLAAHIHRYHYPVTLSYASTGSEAIAELRAGLTPSLLLIDAQMPMMNGYELLIWLMTSEAWRPVPIIVWSGAMAEREVMDYKQAGAQSVVLKEDALRDVRAFYKQWPKLALAA